MGVQVDFVGLRVVVATRGVVVVSEDRVPVGSETLTPSEFKGIVLALLSICDLGVTRGAIVFSFSGHLEEISRAGLGCS